VDLSSQTLFAYQGDTLLKSFLVSTGTRNFPTVPGSFKIYAKSNYYTMRGPGYYLPDVPYSMFFYKGFSIHGTYWHHNFGTPMSHGCVNMETSAAAWLFARTSLGTPVFVHY
jgi:lipoprotein-anchoring transpeptidase ErfK/SrfK